MPMPKRTEPNPLTSNIFKRHPWADVDKDVEPLPKPKTSKGHKRFNAPRGIFLSVFKKGDYTWRVQMSSTGEPDQKKVPRVRFQLWTASENGGTPIKDGPGCGFTLTIREVEKLITDLQKGLEMIRTGEFNPEDENNLIPSRTK